MKHTQKTIKKFHQSNTLHLSKISVNNGQTYINLKFRPTSTRRALIDTGVRANVISNNFDENKANYPIAKLADEMPDGNQVKLAVGQTVEVVKQY